MQAYVKDYLITFVRLLLGVDQAPESGHLACVSALQLHETFTKIMLLIK